MNSGYGFTRMGWKVMGFVAGVVTVSWLLAGGPAVGTATAAEAPSAAKALQNPFAGNSEAITAGGKAFDERCSECHGGDAMGMSGPDLTDDRWQYGGSDTEVFASVSKGRPGGMPSWSGALKDEEIWKVISFLRSLKK